MSEPTRVALAPERIGERPLTLCYSPRSGRNDWSMEDLRRLRELASSGTPVNVIATALRRTPSAVRNKAGMQGISLRLQRQGSGE